MHVFLVFILLGSLFGLFYAYLGYPILVAIIAKKFGRNDQPMDLESSDDLPEVTVLIAAHNAEHYLSERIENIFACDYPSELVTVLVASDGSTDGTALVVSKYIERDVKLISFQQRRGKSATLVEAVKSVSTPVIVFTDATTQFDQQAIRRLAEHFTDPKVGLAAGKVTMVDGRGSASESLYWKIENRIRGWEARLGITLGASGAIYAIRRSMFVAPSRHTINDDLVLPMLVRMTHHCRVAFDPSACAFASSTGGMRAEFSRRQRIGIGAVQCLPALRHLLTWKNRWQAVAFTSHKLIRWTGPFLLVAAFVSNLILATQPVFQLLGLMQLLGYGGAAYGLVTTRQGFVSRLARAGTSFVVMNAAIGFGICRCLIGHDTVIWMPTERPTWSHIPLVPETILASEKRAA